MHLFYTISTSLLIIMVTSGNILLNIMVTRTFLAFLYDVIHYKTK